MSERLYKITYEDEEGNTCEGVVPEWALPEIAEISEIELAGILMEGFVILREEDEDPKDRDDKPILLKRTGTN